MNKSHIQVFLLFVFILYSTNARLTSNDASLLGNINTQLPNLTYKFGNEIIKLNNGVGYPEQKGSIRSATLTDRILNADFNNDGYPDAAVILFIIA